MNEQLTDNDAMLLLYLAGELPDADRQEIAKRLATNPGLAAQLAAMDGVQQQLTASLALLDEVERNRPAAARAIDAAVASMQGWNFGPRRIVTPVAPHRNRIWAWAAPMALAASVLVAALIWIEHRPAGGTGDHTLATNSGKPALSPTDDTVAANDSDTNLALLQRSFSTGFEQPSHRLVPDAKAEVASRDDLSDYLLKTEGQQ